MTSNNNLQRSVASSVFADRERLSASFARTEYVVPDDDGAFKLGREMQAARRRYNQLDELVFEQPKDEFVAKRLCENAGKHEYDRELALRQLISFEPAASVEGALVQVAESITALAMIWDQFPKESEDFMVLQDYRRLERLLFSVLRFLKSQSAQNVDEHCDGLGFDPWVDTEEAIAEHRMVCAELENERLARIQRRAECEAAKAA